MIAAKALTAHQQSRTTHRIDAAIPATMSATGQSDRRVATLSWLVFWAESSIANLFSEIG